MSLLVLPLPSGDDATDRTIQAVLEEFLATLRVGLEDRPEGVRGSEPALVIPPQDARWRDKEHQPFVDAGQVLLPREGGGSQDDRMRRGLRDAFARALTHRVEVGRINDQLAPEESASKSTDVPGLVVLPLLVIPERGSSDREAVSQELIARMRELGDVVRWVEAAAGELVGGATVVGEGAPRDLDLAVIPWIHLPWLPAAEKLPEELFDGPELLGCPLLYPVVYTQRAKSGGGRRWADYGRSRLLTDLFFLHAVSGSLPEVERLFPKATHMAIDPGSRRLYTLHSALFEYPLNELLCEVRLAGLLSSSPERSSVLPDPGKLAGLVEVMEPSIKAQVRERAQKLETLVAAKDCSTKFSFDGDHVHRPSPRFEPFGPAEDRWQRVRDDGLWPIVGPERAADRLHTEVSRALEHCAQDSLDDEMDAALELTRKSIGLQQKELEEELGKVLRLDSYAVDEERKHSKTQAAIGQTLAYLAGIRSAMKGLADSSGPKLDAETVLEGFRQRRKSWCDQEELLLEKGRSQPSMGGLWLELACVAVAVCAVSAMSSLLFFVPLLIGAVLVYLLFKRRSRRLKEYWQEWAILGASFRKDANDAAAGLGVVVEQRTRQVKVIGLQDLQRALAAAEQRFSVELRGLISLVKGQQATLARKRAILADLGAGQGSGRFRFTPSVQVEVLSSSSKHSFHEGLVKLLGGALKLQGMPGRVPVQEHEVLIRGLMEWQQEKKVERLHSQAASGKLKTAIQFGTNFDELSDIGVFPSTDTDAHYVITGRQLAQRLDDTWNESLLDHGVEKWRVFGALQPKNADRIDESRRNAVLCAMAPEVAVVVMVKPWTTEAPTTADASGEGEVVDG